MNKLWVATEFIPWYVEFVLSDTGPGIPSDTIGKIFQPLFTTKAQGIGFGLSITKMIVENHGGTIRAESNPGKGAEFVLELPFTKKRGRANE